MNKIVQFTFALLLSLILIECTPSGSTTLFIQNATIIDGTGSDRFVGSVRIKDDRIIQIGDLAPLNTDSIIDGTGLILGPGFIDTHSHHDQDSLRTKEAAISQGITTIIIGQDGGSLRPLKERFNSIKRSPWSVNIGAYSGHNPIRAAVMGEDYKREATQMEIEAMSALLENDMIHGALGLSTGLEYDPGIYSNSSEVIELAKVASANEGRYISHMRSEDVYFNDAIDEILTIGKEANIPVQISHFKLAMKGLWGKAPIVLQKLDSARAKGIDVTADIYPYQYWSSTMTVLFPNRDFENRETAEFALTELTTPEGMIISTFDAKPEYENLSLAEIAKIRSEDPISTYLELIRMSQLHPSESIIAKSMALEDIMSIMNWPQTNICSDGAPSGHPRGWGAFPRYLDMNTSQTLEVKINKMTAQAAHNLSLDSIGIIREGFFADLVLFNANTIKDKATFENSSLPSEGLEFVMVSGQIVYADQSPTKVFSGRIIKRAN